MYRTAVNSDDGDCGPKHRVGTARQHAGCVLPNSRKVHLFMLSHQRFFRGAHEQGGLCLQR